MLIEGPVLTVIVFDEVKKDKRMQCRIHFGKIFAYFSNSIQKLNNAVTPQDMKHLYKNEFTLLIFLG
jgi:hypothetical protein